MRNYRGWSRTGKNENKLTAVQISNIQFNLLSTSSVSMIIGLGATVAVGARRCAVIIVIIIVASASAMDEQKRLVGEGGVTCRMSVNLRGDHDGGDGLRW